MRFGVFIRRVVAALLVVCVSITSAARAATLDDDVKAVAEANNQFAFDLYARLAKDHPGNLFFSPYSICSALAMTYAGARGETADQMRKVLHFSLPDERLHAAFGKLQNEINAGGSVEGELLYELTIANALWAQQGRTYNAAFGRLLQQYYAADLHLADMASAPDAVRADINQWVASKTAGKIIDIMPKGSLNASSRLVLVNATYFKSRWQTQFDVRETQKGMFHIASDTEVSCQLMTLRHRLSAMENSEMQLLDMPYFGQGLSMLVILPRTAEGFGAIESSLDSQHLKQWQSDLSTHDSLVYFPRFVLSSEQGLRGALESMGTGGMFSNAADFSGIADGGIIHLGQFAHKAFVSVEEKGTEASAVSGEELEMAISVPPMAFRADHPFLFLIMDNHSGAIIYIGRLVNPSI